MRVVDGTRDSLRVVDGDVAGTAAVSTVVGVMPVVFGATIADGGVVDPVTTVPDR